MGSDKKRMSSKDISTIVVAAVALSLVVIVFLKMYTGSSKLDNSADETTVHVYSQINEEGEIVFYTMIEYYTDSGLHASVRYPTLFKETTSEEETTSQESTTIVYVTDENGEKVTDSEGNQVTEIKVVEPPETVIEVITGEDGHTVTNHEGNPVTITATVGDSTSETESETTTEETTKDIWTEVTTTKKIPVRTDYTNETSTANTIVSEINRVREENGLSPLAADSNLTKAARNYSIAKAVGTKAATGTTYFCETPSGGATIYKNIIEHTQAENGEYSKIGVAVIKLNGKYYTSVILS